MNKNYRDIIDLFNDIYVLHENNDISNQTCEKIFSLIYKNYKNLFITAQKISKNIKNKKLLEKNFTSDINQHILYMYVKNLKDIDDETIVKIITYLKQIFDEYCINISELTLYGNNEINMIEAQHIKYFIIPTNTSIREYCFRIFILFYYIQSVFVHRSFITLDFEFNTKKIALMQINFEGKKINGFTNSFIFIIHPPQFEKSYIKFFNKYILENNKIMKILHGSDSLDIPYLYYDLLENNKTAIINFTKTIYDTRFLCEFNNNITNHPEQKCNIYTSLKDRNVITEEKYNELIKNDEEMGPIYEITIDVHKMTKQLLYYTLYDVLFLKFLYLSYINEDRLLHIQINKNSDFYYRDIIPELTRIVFLEKRGILSIINDLKDIIDKMNNYMVKHKNDNMKLIDILDMTLLNVDLKIVPLNAIIEINYFKTNLIILFKYITYQIINKNYDIFMNNQELYNGNLPLSPIIEQLKLLGFDIINKIINEFNEKATEFLIK